MRLAATLVLFALIGPVAAAQQPPAAPAMLTVSGVVTTVNDVPLARVRVSNAGSPYPSIEVGVLTDAQGQFTIRVPATPQPRMAFSKGGYITFTADLPRDAAPVMRVRLSRGGSISGVVVDQTGIPVWGATVTARRARAPVSAAPLATTTNDLGEFRFGGVTEGAYTLVTGPSASSLTGPVAEREKVVAALTVDGPTVTVSTGLDVTNIRLAIVTPSDLPSRVNTRPAEPSPETSGSISGRVITSTGLPVARALVLVHRESILPRLAETDERGRYVIDRLAAGEYSVEVQKGGFVTRKYGQAGTETIGRRVAVRNGQAVGSIDVTLVRGGAIAGTILDEFGEPAEGVTLRLLQIQTLAGRRRALSASFSGSNRTDDRGQYRIAGLSPGAYVVQAQVADAMTGAGGYAPLYHPGMVNIDQATPTKVTLDAAVIGVDFTLVPGNTHRVTGTVFDINGKPGRAGVTLAVSDRSGGTQMEPVRVSADSDGSFVFNNVPPGDYAVQATGTITGKDQFGAYIVTGRNFGMAFVTVNAGDPPPVQVRLAPGATLRGRIIYEGLPEAPPRGASLTAYPADFDRGPISGIGPMGFTLQPDSSFEYKGVFGPTLITATPRQSDWYLKSVNFKGQDLADTPFDFGGDGVFSDIEVVIATRGAEVTGRVTDDRAVPVGDYVVLAFSTFRDRWFPGSRWMKTGTPSQDGTYRVQGLPPGDYWVAAIDRVESSVGGNLALPETDLLEPLSARATRITLGDGQSQDVTLRLIRR